MMRNESAREPQSESTPTDAPERDHAGPTSARERHLHGSTSGRLPFERTFSGRLRLGRILEILKEDGHEDPFVGFFVLLNGDDELVERLGDGAILVLDADWNVPRVPVDEDVEP